MNFVIEDHVPVPQKRTRQIYPIPELQVGQSFFFDGGEKQRNSVSAACYVHRQGTAKEFTIKKVDGGFRCWRIK